MLNSHNFKLMFSFAMVSNIAITTLKFVNKVEIKIYENGFLKFRKATLKNFIHSKYSVRSLITTVLPLSAFLITRSLHSIKSFNSI